MDHGNVALLWTSLPDGTIEYLCPQWLAYHGLTMAGAVGTGWAALIHPDDRAGLLAKWETALQTGTTYETDARLRRHDGEYRWFRKRAEPQRNENGDIIRWSGANIAIPPPPQLGAVGKFGNVCVGERIAFVKELDYDPRALIRRAEGATVVDVIPDQGSVYEVSDQRLLELVKTHHRMTEACLANGHAHSAHDYVDTAVLLLELVEARQSLRGYRVAAQAQASRLAMAERDALATLNGKKSQGLPPLARQ
jgi:PAS domain S-box-containing protein